LPVDFLGRMQSWWLFGFGKDYIAIRTIASVGLNDRVVVNVQLMFNVTLTCFCFLFMRFERTFIFIILYTACSQTVAKKCYTAIFHTINAKS
jgi:hypothetical protein